MRLPDVNVLLHAVNSASPEHDRAARWLADAIDGEEGLALAWVALLGFIRISTRPGIFARPLSIDHALAIVEHWLRADGVRVVNPGERHAAILSSLLRHAGSAGNLTTDAHLAALAIETDALLGTFDRDFDRFPNLRVEHLAHASGP
ncbi:MAG TPA: PIN domain-containing protein [Rubrivivax sp.]|nr:PIN domain-containing protein [Burkholderiales bacterium]HNT38974.1 PIN domain-containing protein [Rubrivivax sp.]